MLAWHVPYLNWTRLPAEVSDFEITHFFLLDAEERSAVSTRYRDSLRLGAARQIGFLKMCGRPLDAIQRVPTNSAATKRARSQKHPANPRPWSNHRLAN